MTDPRAWIEQSQQYLGAGDYTRALQTAQAALVQCPGDARLLELVKAIRSHQERGLQALERVMRARESSERGATGEALAQMREAYQLDPRNSVIRTVLINLMLEQAERVRPSDSKAAAALVAEALALDPGHGEALAMAHRIAAPPPRSFSTAETVELSSAALPLPPPAVSEPTPTPARPAVEDQSRKLLLGTGLAVALLLVIASLVTYYRHRAPAPQPGPPAKLQVVVHSSPEGAEIRVNGTTCGISTCQLELAPGAYPVEAQLSGYQPAASNITVATGQSADFVLNLNPLPPRAAIFTDLPDGNVSLDGVPVGAIQGGGAEVPNLTPGKHTLFVQGGDSSAAIPIEIVAGAAPKPAGPIETVNLRAFVVAGYAGDAHVYGSATGSHATVDGKAAGDVGADGISLQGLTPGTHELVIDSQSGQHDKIVFESQPSSTLYISLGASANAGTLTVETNEDQAQLYINGQKFSRVTRRGKLAVSLPPKKYTVSLQKDGFAAVPDQTIEIKRGMDSKLTFRLQPAKATLVVQHAPGGTEVLVDGNRVGTTNPAGGEFQVSTIDPGSHSIVLRRERFKPLQFTETFSSGKPVVVDGALEAVVVTGTLRLDITPSGPEVKVRVQREGEPEREVTGPLVTLPEGRYTVTASAPQYQTATATVTVSPTSNAVASLVLRRPELPKGAAPKAVAHTGGFGLEDWMRAGGWKQEANMITRTGGNYVLAPVDVEEGTARFTVASLKGKRVECVVGYRDDRNFFYFALDDKNLTRYEVNNGNKSTQVKVAHGLDRKEPMGVTVDMSPRLIVIGVRRGGQWVQVDKWDVFSGRATGKFGFHLPGGDEIGLLDFHLTGN